jgi:hypothetical protein
VTDGSTAQRSRFSDRLEWLADIVADRASHQDVAIPLRFRPRRGDFVGHPHRQPYHAAQMIGLGAAASHRRTRVALRRQVGVAVWVTSMVAFGGNSFGLIAPIITGYIVAGTGGYRGAFVVAAILLACGAGATLPLTRQRVLPASAAIAPVPQTL